MEPVTGADVELVKGLVQEHHQLTGSTVAERLLEDWDSSVNMFVKVQLDKGQSVEFFSAMIIPSKVNLCPLAAVFH